MTVFEFLTVAFAAVAAIWLAELLYALPPRGRHR